MFNVIPWCFLKELMSVLFSTWQKSTCCRPAGRPQRPSEQNLANTSRAEFNNRSTFKFYFSHCTQHFDRKCLRTSPVQRFLPPGALQLGNRMISNGSKRNTPCAESLLLTPPARDLLPSGRHHLQLANDALLFKASCLEVFRLPEGEGGGGIPLQWVSSCSSTSASEGAALPVWIHF